MTRAEVIEMVACDLVCDQDDEDKLNANLEALLEALSLPHDFSDDRDFGEWLDRSVEEDSRKVWP